MYIPAVQDVVARGWKPVPRDPELRLPCYLDPDLAFRFLFPQSDNSAKLSVLFLFSSYYAGEMGTEILVSPADTAVFLMRHIFPFSAWLARFDGWTQLTVLVELEVIPWQGLMR